MDSFPDTRSTVLTVAVENNDERASHTVAGAPDPITFRIVPHPYPRGGRQRGSERESTGKVNPQSLRSRAGLTHGVARKLEEIGQAMYPMTARSDLADVLDSPENAQKFNGLVEDIRYALIDYHVCAPE